MKINNLGDFLQFVRGNGLANLAPELQAFVPCMEEYTRLCECDPADIRRAKYNQCKQLYINFASGAGQYKTQLLSKVAGNSLSFYNDNQLISTVTR